LMMPAAVIDDRVTPTQAEQVGQSRERTALTRSPEMGSGTRLFGLRIVHRH
jgi:hypothetical protein